MRRRCISQIDLHEVYGGVVPELASRDHVRKALPMIDAMLADAGVAPADIDGVAYTAGPGLIGALLVGASLGRALAMGWGVPALGVHHMEGHLLAPMLEAEPPEFPFVALLVSGGHTQLVDVEGIGRYALLGESRRRRRRRSLRQDRQAARPAYPGGPALAKLAEQGRAGRFEFPRPMVNRPGLDFSFSGLKTYAKNAIAHERDVNGDIDDQTRADLALAFEQAIVSTLCIKCRRALQQTGRTRLVIAGGVSANRRLRSELGEAVAKLGAKLFYARPEFCTDNGAMIALAGALRLAAGQRDGDAIEVRPRWPLVELAALHA